MRIKQYGSYLNDLFDMRSMSEIHLLLPESANQLPPPITIQCSHGKNLG